MIHNIVLSTLKFEHQIKIKIHFANTGFYNFDDFNLFHIPENEYCFVRAPIQSSYKMIKNQNSMTKSDTVYACILIAPRHMHMKTVIVPKPIKPSIDQSINQSIN